MRGVWVSLMHLALNACRSLFIPSRMRDLTVPSGASSRSAICVWVSPSKKASSMQRRWSGDSTPEGGGRPGAAARASPAAPCPPAGSPLPPLRPPPPRGAATSPGAAGGRGRGSGPASGSSRAASSAPRRSGRPASRPAGRPPAAPPRPRSAGPRMRRSSPERHRPMDLEQARERRPIPGGHPAHEIAILRLPLVHHSGKLPPFSEKAIATGWQTSKRPRSSPSPRRRPRAPGSCAPP